jgi:hypothetical protein
MPRVQISISEIMWTYHVVFIDPASQTAIGRTRRFNSDEMVYEMLRRGRADRETMNIVEMNLTQGRPVMVDLNLTDEQYAKLKTQKR